MQSHDAQFQSIRRHIRRLSLAARRSSGDMTGLMQSAFRGNGMMFEEVRSYVPGDDIRHMDWNVSARLQQPHVKVFREERQQTIRLMIDKSRSMTLALDGRPRNEVALEIAWAFAALADQAQDEIGVEFFNSNEITQRRPRQGLRHILPVLRQLLSDESFFGTSTLVPLLKRIQEEKMTHQVFVFISDLFFEEPSQEIGALIRGLSRRNEVIFIYLHDTGAEKVLQRWPVMVSREIERGSGHMQVRTKSIGSQKDSQVAGVLRQSGADVIEIDHAHIGIKRLGEYLIWRAKKFGKTS